MPTGLIKRTTHRVRRYERVLLEAGQALRSQHSMHDRLRFERLLIKEGLKQGCMFQNQLGVLQAACEHKGSWLALSGHLHRHVEVKLDRSSGRLLVGRYSTKGKLRNADTGSHFLVTAALGHIENVNQAGEAPGFLEIKVSGGTIEAVTKRMVIQDALADAQVSTYEGGAVLRVALGNLEESSRRARREKHFSVTFLVISSANRFVRSPLTIRVLGADKIRADENTQKVDPQDARRYLGSELDAFLYTFRFEDIKDAHFCATARETCARPVEIVTTAQVFFADTGAIFKTWWSTRSLYL